MFHPASICKPQKLDGFSTFLSDNSSILSQQSCLKKRTPLCLQIFKASWKIESDMLFFDDLIRFDTLTVLFF